VKTHNITLVTPTFNAQSLFFFTTSAQIVAWLPFSYSGSPWLPDLKMRAVCLALNGNGNVMM
jgi:hypothetical protein